MRVAEIMKTEVITIDKDAPVKKAAEEMAHYNIRHLPVMDGSNLVGIVSERDVALAQIFTGKDDRLLGNVTVLGPIPVSSVMSEDPAVMNPSDPLIQAAQLAVTKKYGAFPVVEDGKLVGILTTTDLLAAAIEKLG